MSTQTRTRKVMKKILSRPFGTGQSRSFDATFYCMSVDEFMNKKKDVHYLGLIGV
jgi:hypothetical protein